MKLRGALLGAGNIAIRSHAPQWVRNARLREEVEIVAVADLSPANLERARRMVSADRAYARAEDLLRAEDLDFCDICTPPFTHRGLIELAAERGVHVLCEKPMAPTLADTDAVVHAVRRSGIVFQPCHQYHHSPHWQAVKALLPRIGRVLFAEYEVHRTCANPGNAAWNPGWRTDASLAGGGILMDHGTHILYQLAAVLGPPKTVQATVRTLKHHGYGVEDTALLTVDHGTALAQVHLTWAARRRSIHFRFVGESGELIGDDHAVTVQADTKETVVFDQGLSGDPWHAEWYAPLLSDFVARVRSGDRGTEGLEEAASASRIISLAYLSSAQAQAQGLVGPPPRSPRRCGSSSTSKATSGTRPPPSATIEGGGWMAQATLPPPITSASAEEVQDRIVAARRTLGSRLVILGHHYQRDEVIRHADFTGDSFKLAQIAATRPEAEFILFCGVHFMAESADILSAPHQRVILPDMNAGCTMADMADIDQVERAWEDVTSVLGDEVLPVTYMNSTAALKAFVGRHGGAVCTSSNARAVLEWAFRQKPRVLFFPDQHLGKNTAFRMGIPLDRLPVFDPYEDRGGLSDDDMRRAQVLLWKGHCSVHNRFTPEMVDARRAQIPGVKVIVHPECRFEVAQKADAIGSTEGILKTVRESPTGTKWAVGTELNMVNRLARETAPEREVVSLDDCFCVCSTMFRIDPPHVLWALEYLVEGRLVNVVSVPEAIARDAKLALDRMLTIT